MFFVATFLRPVSVVFAQTPTSTTSDLDVATNPATTGEVAQDYEKRLMTCNITSGPEFVACFVWAFYYLVLYPSGKLAEVTAALLDFFIAYSLDSNSYVGNNGDFIGKGWSIIRDIANVSFIFILLYIAIRHILQMGSSNTKKLLVSLIIAALLINFSMFFSKIVIDAGNVLARVFYNNIEIVNPPPDQQGDNSKGKAITVALAEHISPQKILSAPIFDAGNITAQGVPRGKMPNGYAFFILVIAAFINITVSLVFLSTFLLFAARTIGLWFMMIFSPIAFASIAIPGAGSFLGQFGWNGWKDNILKLSFMAPIFMFFLFLAIMFLQIALAQDTPANSSSPEINTLMGVLIPFIVIIVILKQAKKVAVDMSGEFGKGLTKAFGVIAGVAAVAATGGTAFVARATVGRAASGLLQRGNLESKIADAETRGKDQNLSGAARWKARQEAIGLRAMQSRAQKLRDSSFDIRNADKSKMLGGLVGFAAGSLGKNLVRPTMKDIGGSDFNAGKGSKESRGKFEDEKEKEKLKRAEELSEVRFSERDDIISQERDLVRKELLAMNSQKDVIKQGFANESRIIEDRLDQLILKPTLSPAERKEMDDLEKRKEQIPKEQEQKLKKIDEAMEKADIRGDTEALWKKGKEKEETRRRNLYADFVAGENLWGAAMGVDNEEIAHNIRAKKKSKSDAEKLQEIVDKMSKKDKPEEKKPEADSGGDKGEKDKK